MAAPTNTIKAALAKGAVMRGPFLSLGSEAVTEIAGNAGFDFCLIDAEHGPFDAPLVVRQLTILTACGMPAMVRVPSHDAWVLRQMLDAGAQTIMVPMVNTAEQAERIVQACLYPPDGTRGLGGANMRAGGYGTIPGYPVTANAEICLIAQIETLEAMSNIEAIAAVEGIDGLFIGPADLGCDMGLAHDLEAAALWDAVKAGVARIAATGKTAGVFANSNRAPAMVEAGAQIFGVGSDAASVTKALRDLAGAS